MSGGVDSTSTALLLKNRYDVTGFFMRLAQPDIKKQIERVSKVAAKAHIPLHIIDLADAFEKRVLDYFCQSYLEGITPNPCVVCNREIKFGLFLDALMERGMDMMATGHYAGVTKTPQGYSLRKGVDTRKDQSYFLARLRQRQLSRLLFPLGEFTKEEVYSFVEAHGFTDFRGTESQDVCFLENSSIARFLQDRMPQTIAPGNITDVAGTVLGRHSGAAHYTIGQRKGLGISAPQPLYVIGIDAVANTIIVGTDTNLLKEDIDVYDLHWIAGSAPAEQNSFLVKIRSTHTGCTAQLFRGKDDCWTLRFDKPQRAITPGQYAVFYKNDEVMGSAVIAG